MLRYLTAGESHGRLLSAVVEGMPAGLSLAASHIDAELARRQGGYGRGGRMKIEADRVEITSGVRLGRTIGSPIGLEIGNRDSENWAEAMAVAAPPGRIDAREVTRPRPGHADLAGALKYRAGDLRDILERSSARETAARVAVGAVARRLLDEFGIRVYSWVTCIGAESWRPRGRSDPALLFKRAEGSVVRSPGRAATARMKKEIDRAKKAGDSLGGVFEVVVTGVAPGLGSHVHSDRKLDARLAGALMSIQAIKGVEVGVGFRAASLPGSKVHDEIFYRGAKKRARDRYWPSSGGFYRRTNHAGGIEGGMSNGEAIVLRAVMKPIPTLYRPLRSVDVRTKRPFRASVERSDVCAVPAAAVVAESAAAFEVARAFLEKFGGDSVFEIRRNYRGFLDQIRRY